MAHDTLDRRAFLGIAGMATATALAGCTGGSAADSESGTSEATATATETHHEDDGHHGETATDHHEEAEHHEDETTHEEGGHSGEGPVSHAEVAMESTDSGHHFHPHVAWVEPGGTVTFVNESGSHSATAYHPDNGTQQRIPDGAEPFDSGLLTEAGATWEHTFETEGVYDIHCAPHEGLGMIGTVLVGTPDPHDQPGLSDPGTDLPGEAASKIESLNEQVNTMLGHEH